MIWRTFNGRWLARFGAWHPWFAWHPVTLENPSGEVRVERAWLMVVMRLGVVVRGRRFFLYATPAVLGVDQAEPPPAADNVVQLKGKARR